MSRKKKATNSLRKIGPYKLGDLKASGTLTIDLWAMDGPTRSYEATACDVLVQGSELVISFAQTAPESSRVVTAISIGMPINGMKTLLGSFDSIRDRLGTLHFNESDLDCRRLDREQMADMTVQNYRRESAQIIRAVCSDDLAVLDFYRRPVITEKMIEARPQDRLEFDSVIRVRCPAEVLSLMLWQVDQALRKEESDA